MPEPSLLPCNASALERDLEHVMARAFALPVHVKSLWNPATCPHPLLPWLAWALSVDHWEAGWSVATQRAVIAASPQIHRQKGTRGALLRVLRVLGLNARLEEWFEFGGPPHTFQITALVNENRVPERDVILDADLYRSLLNLVRTVKPVRSHFEFRVGAEFSQTLRVAAGTGAITHRRAHVSPEVRFFVAPLSLPVWVSSQTFAVVRAQLEL